MGELFLINKLNSLNGKTIKATIVDNSGKRNIIVGLLNVPRAISGAYKINGTYYPLSIIEHAEELKTEENND